MATRVALRIECPCTFQSVSFPVAKTFALMDQRRMHTHRDTSGKQTSTVAAAYLLMVFFASAAKFFIGITALFAVIMFLKYLLSASSKKMSIFNKS